MAAPPPLDPRNVQGDILAGLPKKTETYFFFRINETHIRTFRTQLNKLVPLITTAAEVLHDHQRIALHKKTVEKKTNGNQQLLTGGAHEKDTHDLLKMSGINIAFTQTGLYKMGVRDDIGDSAFVRGMLPDAEFLGDKGITPPEGSSWPFDPAWIPQFKEEIDVLILVTGDCHATVQERIEEIYRIFFVGEKYATMHQVLHLVGDVRPGVHLGQEHFGFLDGISQPAIKDFDTHPLPGQETVRPGIILLGRDGDVTFRPPWALDGSFLCFRYLTQLVPEFDAFLKSHPIKIPDPSAPHELGSELLGARLVGRWKSGAPIEITPLRDDPALGADPHRNNNFRYDKNPKSQERCPFAAHTRKTNPRDDLPSDEPYRIIRRGIQFGPEVIPSEAASHKTAYDRGLLFVAYQSHIGNGFRFIQQSWANNVKFPPGKGAVLPGFDAIIGQTTDLAPRTRSGADPNDPSKPLVMNQEWVVPKGGGYFFSPSISALEHTFALPVMHPHPHPHSPPQVAA